jgi:hypothetical protein
VTFGHNPNLISTRIARVTYGIEVREEYDPVKHGSSKEGVVQCDKGEYMEGVFYPLVAKGNVLTVGAEIS